MAQPANRRGFLIAIAAALWIVGIVALLDRRFPPSLDRALETSQAVVDMRGEPLRVFLTGDDKYRLSTDVNQVDPVYLSFLKTYEDKRFDRHWGVDPLALMRAIAQWARHGEIVSGASTLTMQTARLLEPRPRSIGAKIFEMMRACQLELHHSKDEILSFYLTLAPFGGNLEGVRAASLAYFGKEPRRLTAAEAALLVGLPQSPERQRPDRHATAAEAARSKVLDRLVEAGAISNVAAAEATSEPVPKRRAAFPFHAPRLAQRLVSRSQEKRIHTAIDRDIQVSLEALARAEAAWQQDGASVAIVAVENTSRDVKAYVGGADFWGEGGQVDLARAARSPGSTLKPFIYGLAFDDLIAHPDTLIDDRPMIFGDYAPQNFDRAFQGSISIRDALRQSLNVPAVALLDRVGPVRLASTLSYGGASLRFARTGAAPSLPLALGGVGLALTDLVQLYASLPNGGEIKTLRLLKSQAQDKPRRIMGRAGAWYVTEALTGSPMPDGWAQRAGIDRPRTIAFKTGTSYGFRDAWAVGYSGTYTVGVWVGRADGSARPGHFGRNTAAPLLLKAFDLLPGETRPLPPKPVNALVVTSRDDLPAAMRRFVPRTDREGVNNREVVPAPRIKFPSNGVTVALPRAHEPDTLALKALGGALPLRWMVNGRLLPSVAMLETPFWRPEGPGFAEVVVIDALGRSDRATVRLANSVH